MCVWGRGGGGRGKCPWTNFYLLKLWRFKTSVIQSMHFINHIIKHSVQWTILAQWRQYLLWKCCYYHCYQWGLLLNCCANEFMEIWAINASNVIMYKTVVQVILWVNLLARYRSSEPHEALWYYYLGRYNDILINIFFTRLQALSCSYHIYYNLSIMNIFVFNKE